DQISAYGEFHRVFAAGAIERKKDRAVVETTGQSATVPIVDRFVIAVRTEADLATIDINQAQAGVVGAPEFEREIVLREGIDLNGESEIAGATDRWIGDELGHARGLAKAALDHAGLVGSQRVGTFGGRVAKRDRVNDGRRGQARKQRRQEDQSGDETQSGTEGLHGVSGDSWEGYAVSGL